VGPALHYFVVNLSVKELKMPKKYRTLLAEDVIENQKGMSRLKHDVYKLTLLIIGMGIEAIVEDSG